MPWFTKSDMYEKNFPSKRYQRTLNFLKKHVPTDEAILDLGVENPFSEIYESEGYRVANTGGEDLDLEISAVQSSSGRGRNRI